MGNERRIKMRRRENLELKIKRADGPKPMALGWKITIWTLSAILVILTGFGIWAYSGRLIEASVGSQKIKTKELENRISFAISQQYTQEQLNQLTMEQKQQLYTSAREQVLQQLIQEKLFFEAAKRQNLSLNEEELTTEAQKIIDEQVKPSLKQQNQDFTAWLKTQGYEGEGAEVRYRDFIKTSQIDQIQLTVFKKKLLDDPILNKIKITDEEAKAFYLSTGAKRISHILIKFDSKNDKPEVGTQAKKTIDEIKKLLDDKKKTFAELAKEKSQDKQKGQDGKETGSALNGGDLGWYAVSGDQLTTQGANGQTAGLVKEFNDVAMKLNKGEISAPVQTQYGWHIIEVTDIKLKSEEYNIPAGVRLGIVKFITVGKADEQGNPQPLPAEELKTKEKTANAVLADIKAGRLSFEEAVKANSEDKLTKENAASPGEIPFGNDKFEKDQAKNKFWATVEEARANSQMGYPYEPEIVDAALKAKPGQVLPTITKTASAIYIVKVIAIRQAKKTFFDEVKELVKKDMESTKRNDEASKWISERQTEYGVRTGNAWKSFTSWWDRNIGSPLSDFGLWIKQFMGKGGSGSTSAPTTTIPGGEGTPTPPPATPTDK
jgi:parvulin-like peptidyl-prolyl isomerase